MNTPRKKVIELTDTQYRWAKAFIAAMGGATNDEVKLKRENPEQLISSKPKQELFGDLKTVDPNRIRMDLLDEDDADDIPFLSRPGFNKNVTKPMQQFVRLVDKLRDNNQPVPENEITDIKNVLRKELRGLKEGNKIRTAIEKRLAAVDRLVNMQSLDKQGRVEKLERLEPTKLALMLAENPALQKAVFAAKPKNLVEVLRLFARQPPELRGQACDVFIDTHEKDPKYIEFVMSRQIKANIEKETPSEFLRGSTIVVDLMRSYSETGGGKEFAQKIFAMGLEQINLGKRNKPAPVLRKNERYKYKEDTGLFAAAADGMVAVLKGLLSIPVKSQPRPLLVCSSIMVDGAIAVGETDLWKLAGMVGGHFFLRMLTPLLSELATGKKSKESGLTEDQGMIGQLVADGLLKAGKGTPPTGTEYEIVKQYVPGLQKLFLENGAGGSGGARSQAPGL